MAKIKVKLFNVYGAGYDYDRETGGNVYYHGISDWDEVEESDITYLEEYVKQNNTRYESQIVLVKEVDNIQQKIESIKELVEIRKQLAIKEAEEKENKKRERLLKKLEKDKKNKEQLYLALKSEFEG